MMFLWLAAVVMSAFVGVTCTAVVLSWRHSRRQAKNGPVRL